MCSHCSRLRQNCYYAEDRHEAERSFSPVSAPIAGGGSAANNGAGPGGVLVSVSLLPILLEVRKIVLALVMSMGERL